MIDDEIRLTSIQTQRRFHVDAETWHFNLAPSCLPRERGGGKLPSECYHLYNSCRETLRAFFAVVYFLPIQRLNRRQIKWLESGAGPGPKLIRYSHLDRATNRMMTRMTEKKASQGTTQAGSIQSA